LNPSQAIFEKIKFLLNISLYHNVG
jgi:hypothetical protein